MLDHLIAGFTSYAKCM